VTTMQDVARRAGVSAKTVSRVFNDDPHVSGRTRELVERAMKDLNYVPNMLARTFREGRAAVIGIAVPDIGDPFFSSIVREVDQVAQSKGYAIAVTSLGEDPSRERAIVEALLRRQMDGLIIAPISTDQSYLNRWLEHLPLVFIDREPQNIAADLFIEDDKQGAMIAVRHLIGRGHTSIAFVGDSQNVITTRRRLEGYREALTAANIEPNDDLLLMTRPEQAPAAISQLVERGLVPTAIFASNSRSSIELVPALQELGRTDIALLSFGDFPMSASLKPSVTVLDQDPARLGRASAERLFARIQSPAKRFKRRTVFEVNLIERETSAVLVAI
jgi:LacI family transcriptional regulator